MGGEEEQQQEGEQEKDKAMVGMKTRDHSKRRMVWHL
jgi:hypothetical protein